MSTKRWDVWSIDRKDCSGLVVVEDVTETEANEAAERKNAAALRHGMAGNVAFAALPAGQRPTWEDLPPPPGPPPARNEHPLHNHADEDEPWTQDTLSAHLHFLHGVDDENVLRSGLSALSIAHAGLKHGKAKPQLRADWAQAPADSGYLGILTDQPHDDRFAGQGQKFAWSCRHVHVRQREAVACAQAELDRRARVAAADADQEPAPLDFLRRDDSPGSGHTYLVKVGNVRGKTPQEVREAAIDIAVGDVPDEGALYEVVPGYVMKVWDGGVQMRSHGDGRMLGLDMVVKITVPADRASWQAPPPGQDEGDLAAEFRAFAGRLARTRIGDPRG